MDMPAWKRRTYITLNLLPVLAWQTWRGWVNTIRNAREMW